MGSTPVGHAVREGFMQGDTKSEQLDRHEVPVARLSWDLIKLTYVGTVGDVMQKVAGSPDQGMARRD
jgi:hypothetical protein